MDDSSEQLSAPDCPRRGSGAAWAEDRPVHAETGQNAVRLLARQGVLHLSARADHGGGPKHIESLLRYGPDDQTVAVACPRDHPYWNEYSRVVGEQYMFELPHRRFDFSVAWRLRRWIRQQGLGLLHAHGKGASVYARFAGAGTEIPLVYTPHGIHTGHYNRLTKAAYVGFERATRELLSGIIFVSEGEREVAEALGLWRGRPKWVIPNAVSVPTFAEMYSARADGRAMLGLGEGDTLVLTASRFDFQKNMRVALDVARACPDLVFGWLGDGPDKSALGRLIEREQVPNIRLLGAIDDPGPYFAAADIYLSTSRWEGMPLAVLEAMAHGVPVVASNVVGNRDLVHDQENGLLYQCSEAADAAAAIRRITADMTLRKRLGMHARKARQNGYSVQTMAYNTWAVYDSLWRAKR